MKKLIFLLIAFMASIEIIQAGVQGALPGAFTVSYSNEKVYFSKGNLQYQASTQTWRFAEHQYNIIGSANANISSTYNGWIDLFGWGTGNNPTNTSTNSLKYVNYSDWGNNNISNGGNVSNLWRTLTAYEWSHIYSGRPNAQYLRGCGRVNGVNGYIFLPDNWSLPTGVSFTANDYNVYSLSDWSKMESAGAIFLPYAGMREYKTIEYVDKGFYSSSSNSRETTCKYFYFYGDYAVPDAAQEKCLGNSVRLVIDSDKNVAYTITWKNWDGTTLATTSVLKGATPSYTGATPTRPSTAQYTYTFSGWTPSITAATANKTYTATYTATPRYTIAFNANGGLIPTGGNMGNTPSGHITTLSADRTSGTVVVTKDKSHFQTMTNDCPSREGYTFAGWYTDPTSGVQVYDNTGYRVVGTYWNSEGKWIGTSNVTLYAHWTPIPYTITVNSFNVSQGSASGGGTYDYGTNHQITATPNECYRFIQWSDGNTDNPRTITVTGNATYTAEFEQIQYTIEAQSADAGQGSATVTNP